jgi:NADPH:quinone reductase-like Zn-dependent oxidoreductase
MRAVAIDAFGGIDKLKLQTVPVPQPGPGEVLIRVAFAGVAVWDPIEREGIFAKMMKLTPKFPLVLGSDGAGEVVAVGADVKTPRVGDTVYAAGFLNPKGGFYAEYAAIDAGLTTAPPPGMTLEQAAAFPGDAGTALRGLDDILHLKSGETVMIFGAGGGLGHLAVQLAKRMGAKVLAVASGADGVNLAKQIGADAVVDGRADDVTAAVRKFAPAGLDAALLAAGGKVADGALTALRAGGRVAFPNGVEPKPIAPAGVKVSSYDGNLDAELIKRLHDLIGTAPFVVHVARTFLLENAAEAQRMLDSHYLGKIALRVE